MRRRSECGTVGFSLVEVVLATGLATFALLVIFSLMPAGFSALQASSRQIAETGIFNALGAELAATKFSDLAGSVSDRFPVGYDGEGLEQSGTNGAVFIADCMLHPPELQGQLQRASISIGYRQAPGNAVPANVVRRSFLLVDRGL